LKVIFDIEANALTNPTRIWLIVCKEIESGTVRIFREGDKDAFLEYASTVTLWVGHNALGYDCPVLHTLLGLIIPVGMVLDTLILSKIIDYSRNGHSIEDYGIEFGLEKGKFSDFSKYSKEMEDYCVRDVEICERIYNKYRRYHSNPEHAKSIKLEHEFQCVVNRLHTNGFGFNRIRAEKLLEKVTTELGKLDKEILEAFPPRLKLIREIHPKETKHGTLSKTDFRWVTDGDLSIYNGGSFCRCRWECFNPSSHKQIVQVLSDSKWSPIDKTKTHIDTEREYNKLRYSKGNGVDSKKKELYTRLQELRITGWKVNETNLDTLPSKAPLAARLLAKRILLESRRRTLTEWLGLSRPAAMNVSMGSFTASALGLIGWRIKILIQLTFPMSLILRGRRSF
jgi:hypothetical protein